MSDQCLFCRHFVHDGDDQQPDIGFCRRYPPQLVMDDGEPMSAFPLVSEDESCGEFCRRTN